MLTLAAASFLYIAVAGLMPMLDRRRMPTDILQQTGLTAAVVASVYRLPGACIHPHG